MRALRVADGTAALVDIPAPAPDGEALIRVTLAAEPGVLKILLATAVALAAGCGSEPTCIVDDVINDRVGQQELADCGDVRFADPIATLTAARDCAVTNHAASLPFRVQFELDPANGPGGFSWIGLFEAATYHAYFFGSTPQPLTSTYSCGSITESAGCDDTRLRQGLCLDCAPMTLIESCPPL